MPAIDTVPQTGYDA